MPARPSVIRRALVPALVGALLLLGGCARSDQDAPALVRVPADAATVGEAIGLVAENGLVLVDPGVYREQILVDKPGVTVRGVDRNETVIDGEGIRPYGVVAVADGVSVENLTVTGATFYGVLVTGLHDEDGPTAHGGDGYDLLDPERFPPIQRFAIDHVTAYDNGLYGLYAFDAQHGVIRDSYASGSADSGIYVGQCRQCDILVTGNVAENNAVGFENANASDSVWIVGNRFSGNRIGMTLISNYREAFVPQRGNLIAGNLIADNAEAESPAHADGGFGVGVGVSGGTENVFERNRIERNPVAGVVLTSTEDLAATGNRFRDTAFAGNGIDIANTSTDRAPARGNCLDGPVVAAPLDLFAACTGAQPAVLPSALPAVAVPPGMSFLRVPPPPAQPNMPDVTAPARILPAEIGAPDAAAHPLPDSTLLADRSRR
ncbi:right-handed parallel beta-helix repeat-containing protein [Microbacterium sp. zg.Y909]|uniref:right-handed parallel beta-helix repeat-containing protein n=1 Tax=Microbacterium sp. zg.Y909 TaxID=2969413 RepID=UPI00214B15C0|nr:right-handed parallel beta-helix repeat-containing protein [Microbacterium sp. zg.Y909]MCR2825695.1 right-handed parallel beta-helix repeat-containing protein [Microbacterium sp. zg.Y909]